MHSETLSQNKTNWTDTVLYSCVLERMKSWVNGIVDKGTALPRTAYGMARPPPGPSTDVARACKKH